MMSGFLRFVGLVTGCAVALAAVPEGVARGVGSVPEAPRSAAGLPVGSDGLVSLSGLARQDWTAASVTARAAGKPVEVLAERTESKRLWLWPDGRVQVEQAAGPVQFPEASTKDSQRDANHGWQRLDTSLQPSGDGAFVPKAMPGKVRLGDGGSAPVITMTDASGSGVSLALPGVSLPKPVVEGSSLRYRNVLEGVDATVEVRPAGFELLWVVKDAAAAQRLAAQYGQGDGVVLPTSVSSPQGEVAAQADGSVQVEAKQGAKAGRLGAPLVWDAKAGARDPRAVVTRGAWRVKQKTRAVSGRGSKAQAGVGVQKAWLLDKARTFPVSIDPTYQSSTTKPAFDTFVEQGFTTDESGSSELKLGNNGSNQVARTFINFNGSAFKGKQVTSASLSLYETWSWSCSARAWSAWYAKGASSASRWTSMPYIGQKGAVSTQTKGAGASCAPGRVSIDMTAQTKWWSGQSDSVLGMMLRAEDETDPYGWKRFSSSESSNPPVLTLFYNTASGTPNAPQVSGPVASGVQWTSTTPTLTSVLPADRDGDLVKVEFDRFSSATATTGGTKLCETAAGAGGSTKSCTSGAMPDNATYWIRSRAFDGRSWTGFSAATKVTVANSAPSAPSISCPVANNGWRESSVAKLNCTVTVAGSTTSAPLTVEIQVNSGATQTTKIAQPTASASRTVSVAVGGAAGRYTIKATAVSALGKKSSATTYMFGLGSVGITAPKPGAVPVTTDRVDLQVTGPAAAGQVTGQAWWRVAGASGDGGWVALPANAVTLKTTATTSGAQTGGLVDLSALVGATDGNGVKVPSRVPATIQLRGCLVYDGTAKCATGAAIRVPHAYGSGFPTTQAGPMNVALWTGETQLSETDATFEAPGGSLAVSRTFSSLAGPADSPVNAVFGPGWVGGFSVDGDDGLSGSVLVDGTGVDGTLALVDEEGAALVFATPNQQRRTTAAIPTGTYVPATQDTKDAGLQLQVNGSGAQTTAVVTDGDGVQTTFRLVTAPTSATGEGVFEVAQVADKVSGETSSYTWDAQGYPTRILAAATDGLACTNPSAAGCRSLTLAYTTVANQRRLASVTAWNGPTSQSLTSYGYDAAGRLTKVTDQLTGLFTVYGYDASNRLTSLVPAGQAKPFGFEYSAEKLVKVTHAQPDSIGGTQQVAAIAPLPSLGSVTPALNVAQFDGYDLSRRADRGFAVFGPDRPLSGAPFGADWQYATVYLTDAEGYLIHTGSTGGGTWQWDAHEYDAQDNIIKSWDQRATEAIRNTQNAEGSEGVGSVDDLASLTTFNTETDKTAAGQLYGAPGTAVLETLSPAAWFSTSSGERVYGRVKTSTATDQGAPNNGLNPATGKPWLLPTTVTTTSVNIDGDLIETLNTTTNDYSGTSTGPAARTGWQLGRATSVTSGGITTRTQFDDRGRTVGTPQPLSTGTDAGTRRTVYYTADDSAALAACRNQPAQAGLVCSSGPADGTILPTTTTEYDTWGKPLTQTTLSAEKTVTQTTTIGYDQAWRPVTSKTSTTGLTDAGDLPETTTTWDPGTGLVTRTNNSQGTTTTGYDQWNRPISYATTAPDGTTTGSTTTYDALGQVTGVTETLNGAVVSSRTQNWDGVDANGNIETRGLLTKITHTADGNTWTATAAYDAQGQLTLERLPGQIVRRTLYDQAGELVSQTWNGPLTDPDTGQTTPDQPWLGWSSASDAQGRVVREWTPDGAAGYTGALGTTATSSDASYSYDPAGRLVAVQDLRTVPGQASTCTTRQYWFDHNGNRTGQATTTPQVPAPANEETPTTDAGADTSSGPTCQKATSPHKTRAFDVADRPTSGANNTGQYVYDPLGRQMLIPAVDTPHPTDGDLHLDYYANDAVRSIKQGDTQLAYTLDANGRRATETNTSTGAGGGPGVRSTITRYYTDGSDNPSWTTQTPDTTAINPPAQNPPTPAAPSLSRFIELTDGGLGLTSTTTNGTTETSLQVTTPRGDVVTSIDLTAAGGDAASGIQGWNTNDEYGNPTATEGEDVAGAGINYGWIGAKQRATNTFGLTLMGARLYNPVTGTFTTLDPIYKGNDTSYAYPNDPINHQDTTGLNPGLVLGSAGVSIFTILAVSVGAMIAAMIIAALLDQIVRLGWWNGSVATVRAVPKSVRVASKIARPQYSSSQKNVRYRLYEVTYREAGRTRTWKYGITAVQGNSRPLVGVRGCNNDNRRGCSFKWRGSRQGYYNARLWEFGSISAYWLVYDRCPPGQDKRICR